MVLGIQEAVYSWLRNHTKGKAPPSKIYLSRLLSRDLDELGQVTTGADIASAQFKHAHWFETDVYFGVDIDSERLRDGIDRFDGMGCKTHYVPGPLSEKEMETYQRQSEEIYVALEADMLNEIFPPNSLELVVSTHTLHWVSHTKQKQIVDNICSYVRPGGTFLLQISDKEALTQTLESKLRQEFDTVEIVPYRNVLSELMIHLLELPDSDNQATLPGVQSLRGKLLFLLVSCSNLLLAAVEHAQVLDGSFVYVRCINKY
jgi:hypothetical protein